VVYLSTYSFTFTINGRRTVSFVRRKREDKIILLEEKPAASYPIHLSISSLVVGRKRQREHKKEPDLLPLE
jgi:hypothetical protein